MVTLVKSTDENDDVNERFAWGMDNESWNSTVLLPMYISTIFERDMGRAIYSGLTNNLPSAFAELLWTENHYDNTTGKLV